MGKNTKIPWATNSWSPWWGCSKLLDRRGCDRCYAASFAKRVGKNVWGPSATRRIASPKIWTDPYAWNREAADKDTRPRVFCMSMGDFLEDRPELVEPRAKACRIIEETINLEWLILTKRIENAGLLPWRAGEFPEHVRMGITVEDQRQWDLGFPHLARLRCKTFFSVEPMLGPIEMSMIGTLPAEWTGGAYRPVSSAIGWVICGAESAPGKRLGRTLELDWVRSLRDQCAWAEVPFFYKQGPVDGKLVELPELDGRVWAEVPR